MEEGTLRINKAYAEAYEKKKKAEELSKLKDKYGSDIESDSSSSSENEDDDAVGVTSRNRKDFLKTLSLVKNKDPRIYDKKVELYKEESSDSTDDDTNEGSASQSKPVYLRDYERARVLKSAEGVESDEEEEKPSTREKLLYNEEQRTLKQDLLAAADASEDIDTLLAVRHKSKEEKEAEEDDYVKWLKGQEVELGSEETQDMETLQNYWNNPSIEPGEAFLRDYILNSMWIDKDQTRLPTYDEIVEEDQEILVSEDEEELDQQDDFEKTYNFRFEEPGGTNIVTYPRSIPGTVRALDEKRAEKRRARDERKQMEKQQKQEELKRLKNLKRQEILAKLDKLKELTGNASVGFTEEDIDGDFDPTKYDEIMQKVFNNEYYEDPANGEDEEKPVFSDSEAEEDWDEWAPPTNPDDINYDDDDGPHCEDPDFSMDADYPQEDESQGKMSKRKRRRVSMLSRALKKKKPHFEPEEKSFEEYFDEYYKLDYEDVIGDLPCRFHYRSVVPNDFGLTTEEILTCEDKELNKWASLKKAVKYRTKEEEKGDFRKYQKKAANAVRKKQILVSLKDCVEEDKLVKKKKRKEKKKKKDKKSEVADEVKTKKKRSKKGKNTLASLSKNRLAAYGLTLHTKTKTKKKKKE